ncbi:hypothetical protein MPLDJ20_340013 [Mesorhizobium plurifarium]|uniref:Uncharacterized protein n=1 Tax=Mesorhizobium plurifarium TaxID=69974 RepID=A0A090GNY5_MESPL|nr:hypothetical protein MPLDJ20_340013 [Mesorhizobium plurifarium]
MMSDEFQFSSVVKRKGEGVNAESTYAYNLVTDGDSCYAFNRRLRLAADTDEVVILGRSKERSDARSP